VRKILVLGVVVAALGLLALAGCRQTLQHRAIYPGGLTFVGAADGLFGSRYHRVYLWRAPGSTAPLTPFAVHIEDAAYRLDHMTPEILSGLGAFRDALAFYDTTGTLLQCRFEGGQLTWFSLTAGAGAAGQGPGGNVKAGAFSLSRGGGPPVRLPASGDTLREGLGRPERTMLHFAQ